MRLRYFNYLIVEFLTTCKVKILFKYSSVNANKQLLVENIWILKWFTICRIQMNYAEDNGNRLDIYQSCFSNMTRILIQSLMALKSRKMEGLKKSVGRGLRSRLVITYSPLHYAETLDCACPAWNKFQPVSFRSLSLTPYFYFILL